MSGSQSARFNLRPGIIGVLVSLLLLGHPVAAEPFSATQALDQRMIAQVTGAALAFMAPRTLEEIPTAQLSIWGLRGLTTLDPRLVAELSPELLRLSADGKLLFIRARPANDPAAWGEAVGQLSRAGWDVSEPLRRTGTEGVLRSFFDELLNHLDPYSRYATPDAAAEEDDRRNGRAGVGLDVVRIGPAFRIRAVAPGSPAMDAHIRPGEMLTEIDGEALAGAAPAAVAALLAGPEDTEVSLMVGPSARLQRRMTLQRVILTPPTVFTQRSNDIVLIRISAFAHDTAGLLAREIRRAMASGRPPKGLVLDLRDNRGGLLRQAVASAETLISTGNIATTAGRHPASMHEYQADAVDLLRGLPVVVVVDGGTASAAEVLAAALADQRRAVVVGSATLGKGLVQTILPLPDGGALSLTWSRILAPLGWPLQSLGVLPQICTTQSDAALRSTLRELAHGEQPMAASLARHRSARAPLPSAEILDIRNACPASEGREADLVTARFLIETPLAYRTALIPEPPAP